MRLHIAGGLTVKSVEVTERLSDRLGLDCKTVKNKFNYPISYTEDTKEFLEFWSTTEDCVVNSLTIPITEDDDAVHVLLIGELISERDVPGTFYLQKEAERSLGDWYDYNKYQIIINTTYLSVEDIVQRIIDCLVNGERGHYVHPAALLPSSEFEALPIDWEKVYLDKKYVFRVHRFYSSLLLMDNFQQALLYAKVGKLLKIHEQTTTEFETVPMQIYESWGKCCGKNNESQLLGIMLSKYCAKFALYNSDETYCSLAQNGNPYKKLIEMGFYE